MHVTHTSATRISVTHLSYYYQNASTEERVELNPSRRDFGQRTS